jgi:hypothetical protein
MNPTPAKRALLTYLELLEADTLGQLEERSVASLKHALQSSGQLSPPFRLSACAKEFFIEPNPSFVASGAEGYIRFDEGSGRFVIRLPSSAINNQKGRNLFQVGELELLQRHRFTYAHEFAHRFFFVARGGTWVRAVKLVAESLERRDRGRGADYLSRIEEKLCNNIARRVLVSDEVLARHLGGGSAGLSLDADPQFFMKIASAAAECGVSADVMLVHFEKSSGKAWERDGDFFAAIIASSDRKGEGRRGRTDLRARVIVWGPRASGAGGIRRPFPGISVGNFGEPFRKFALDGLRRGRRAAGEVDVPLNIMPKGATRRVARLLGRWQVVTTAAATDGGSIAVWGTLNL